MCTQDVPAPIEVQTQQAQCQYEQVGATDGAAAAGDNSPVTWQGSHDTSRECLLIALQIEERNISPGVLCEVPGKVSDTDYDGGGELVRTAPHNESQIWYYKISPTITNL